MCNCYRSSGILIQDNDTNKEDNNSFIINRTDNNNNNSNTRRLLLQMYAAMGCNACALNLDQRNRYSSLYTVEVSAPEKDSSPRSDHRDGAVVWRFTNLNAWKEF